MDKSKNYYMFFFLGQRKRRTKEELFNKKNKLFDLIKSGMSVSEAANELGLSRNTSYKWLENTGIEKRGQYSKAEELSSEIIRLSNEGYGYRQIARKLNVTRNTVRTWCRKNNIKVREYTPVGKCKPEEEIKEIVSKQNYTYLGGYENYHSNITIRCNICGTVSTKYYPKFQDHVKHRPVCYECMRIETTKKQEERKRQREIKEKLNIQERESRKRHKTLTLFISQLKRLHHCPVCDKLTLRRIYCSKECGRKVENKVRELSRRRKIEKAMVDRDITVKRLYQKDNGICHICGKQTNLQDYKVIENGTIVCGNDYPSIDHVIPLSKGGLHEWSNVHLAHRICNTIKGAN